LVREMLKNNATPRNILLIFWYIRFLFIIIIFTGILILTCILMIILHLTNLLLRKRLKKLEQQASLWPSKGCVPKRESIFGLFYMSRTLSRLYSSLCKINHIFLACNCIYYNYFSHVRFKWVTPIVTS
jgi:hypothetical protein